MPPRLWSMLPGYGAILLWSFAALLISLTSGIPPLLVASMASVVGFALFIGVWSVRPTRLAAVMRQPWQVWALYSIPMISYQGFYIVGFSTAPVIEANLLNYLWPLLTVLWLTQECGGRWSSRVVGGALACFAGVICIGVNNASGALNFSFMPGHVLAILGACVWTIFSVLVQRYPAAPLDIFGVWYGVAALLFWVLHRQMEAPVEFGAISWLGWSGIVGLGVVLPLGDCLWSMAMKQENRDRIAVAAYMTPLLSTFWLALRYGDEVTALVWLAAGLILGGALLARSGAPRQKLEA
ncbi:MAG: EamA family transporter [Alphaproteobacteria bacterium]